MDGKINQICRLCLGEEADLKSIFEDEQDQKYCDIVQKYIGFEINQDDNLPSCICNTCSSDLLLVANFIDKCRAANDKLQNALGVAKEEILSSDVKEEIPFLDMAVIVKEEKIEEDYDDPQDIDYQPDDEMEEEKDVKLKMPSKRKGRSKHTLVGGKRIGDNKIKCDTCGLIVGNVASMVVHNRTHTGEKPYKCPECTKCFGLKGTMLEHFNRLHRKTEYLASSSCICDICGKKCYKKNDLKVHMRTHTKERPYACKYCPQRFTQTSSLMEHTRVHVGEKSMSCHMCGKGFLRKSSLRRHLMVHSDEPKKYQCNLCSKSVKTMQALKTHLVLHTMEKTHICEVCGASFAQKGNLKAHILSKHSEKSGECKICKKTYSDLAEHNRKHTGDKPYACTHCPKRFTNLRSLRVHMKWHTETDKYPCTYKGCAITFPTNRQLEYHILKIHEKYAPYVCKVCNKAYYRQSDLKQHKLLSCKGIIDTGEAKNAILSSLVDS